MVWTDFELWCASDGRGTVALRTSANGGFMRKTNVNNSLQHAYGTARGVGRRRGSPDVPKSREVNPMCKFTGKGSLAEVRLVPARVVSASRMSCKTPPIKPGTVIVAFSFNGQDFRQLTDQPFTYRPCQPGYFSASMFDPCLACKPGEYNFLKDQRRCTPCDIEEYQVSVSD